MFTDTHLVHRWSDYWFPPRSHRRKRVARIIKPSQTVSARNRQQTVTLRSPLPLKVTRAIEVTHKQLQRLMTSTCKFRNPCRATATTDTSCLTKTISSNDRVKIVTGSIGSAISSLVAIDFSQLYRSAFTVPPIATHLLAVQATNTFLCQNRRTDTRLGALQLRVPPLYPVLRKGHMDLEAVAMCRRLPILQLRGMNYSITFFFTSYNSVSVYYYSITLKHQYYPSTENIGTVTTKVIFPHRFHLLVILNIERILHF